MRLGWIDDENVLRAMGAVPRHRFVPPELRLYAYDDRPLPIGCGQTISQPSIVALMTSLLKLGKDVRVLEIGTGSGYQTAILAELAGEIYTVEFLADLSSRAETLLHALGYANIHFRVADGYDGWPEHAPYEAIVVTAAPDHVPEPLVEQLAEGGRLVLPVGPAHAPQTLHRLVKKGAETRLEDHGGCVFVPLIRDWNPAD